MDSKLSIAIPTYNRAEILKFNLIQVIDELVLYSIPVYISDDSTNNETKVIIDELREQHSLIYYFRNNPSLGHDLNCLHTMLLPKEDYVWYIGDSMIIEQGAIERIVSAINMQDYDFISFNAQSRNFTLKTQVFNNANEVFNKLCWHLTMTGTTVYNKKKISILNTLEVEKFKNFPQTAIIFEHFLKSGTTLYWINEKLIYGNAKKTSYWFKKVFEVFLYDFRFFITNLSENYPENEKENVIYQHSVLSGIFSYGNLLNYRINGAFDYLTFIKYKKDLRMLPGFKLIFIIAILPKKMLSFIYNWNKKTNFLIKMNKQESKL